MKIGTGARAVTGAAAASGVALALYAKHLRIVQAEQRRLLADAARSAADAATERSHSARTTELLQITDAALSALPLDELFGELLRRVCAGLPADAAALLLLDAPHHELMVRAAYGFDSMGEGGTLRPGIGLAARVAEERHAVALLDAEVADVRLTALRDMGAVAGAPLLADGQVMGVLEVGRREAVPFDAEDLGLLQLAADRTALAVDHGRIFERERYIAETLQRSLLPSQMPDIPGGELQARFVPAGRGQQIGGDFYDVIGLREDSWLLVIGDVCGKGPEAAALTAMVRYTLRAEAVHESRPAELLGLLNDAILVQRSDYLFCTAVCARVDLRGGRAEVTLAGGGHPMPLLIRRDGPVTPPRDPGGPLIGVWTDAQFLEQRDSLEPGDALILYTDGLLEAHAPERIITPEALAHLASRRGRHPLARRLRLLENAALGESIEPVRDDIAILAFSLIDPTTQARAAPGRRTRPLTRDEPPPMDGTSRGPEIPRSRRNWPAIEHCPRARLPPRVDRHLCRSDQPDLRELPLPQRPRCQPDARRP